MKNLSLKLDDAVFDEAERLLKQVKKSRNRYINDAVRFYNWSVQNRLLAEQLQRESSLSAGDSMRVLAEFEALEDGDSAV